MTAATVAPPQPTREGWRPSLIATSLLRWRLELRAFRRVREEVVFTFALPIILLSLFASVFTGEIDDTGVAFTQYYVAGMLAATGLTVGFQSLSGQLSLERQDGTLKRLAGTPMPKAAYVAGKVGLVMTVAAIQTATMFALGVLFFDVSLPTGIGWVHLVAMLALNLAIWVFLGAAFSRVIRNPRAAAAVAVPPALVLQFISGVYLYFAELPSGLRTVASIFPLRWTALGMRQALLPDVFRHAEPGGSWQTGTVYLMLVGWLIGSAALAALMFRWRGQE